MVAAAPARVRIRVGGAEILALESAEAAVREAVERGTLYAAAARDAVGSAGSGRGPVHLVETAAGRWAVRRYRRGGWMRWLGERYLRLGEPRPFREMAVSDGLRARGVSTPEVVAAAVYPAGPWYRGDLATRAVRSSHDLASILFGDAGGVGAEPAAAAAGAAVRRLHEAGGLHPDLNLQNLLVGADGEAWVLDLDRCRLLPGLSASHRRRMLERLWRSATRWEAAAGRRLEPGVREAFERGYESAAS